MVYGIIFPKKGDIMPDLWIKNGSAKTRAVEIVCKGCEKKMLVRKTRAHTHQGYCNPCRTAQTGKEYKHNLVDRKGFRKENALVRQPGYQNRYSKTYRQNRKCEIVKLMGNKCAHCGASDLPIHNYVLHHKDPKTKKFKLSQLVQTSKYRDELDKCEMLCLHCHAIEHYGALRLSDFESQVIE